MKWQDDPNRAPESPRKVSSHCVHGNDQVEVLYKRGCIKNVRRVLLQLTQTAPPGNFLQISILLEAVPFMSVGCKQRL
jgi:hypothetical protein